MEVHPHSHHPHKKWTHYLWDFLMLFLAVTLGFLVENQREHYVEHIREKQFIKSLVADLQGDTAILRNDMDHLKLVTVLMDSLIIILNDKNLVKQSGDQLYYFGRLAPRIVTYPTNNRTFEQLKNSGGFRLIRNTEASNKIMDYYNSIPFIRQLEDVYSREFEEYKRIASKIFEPSVFRMMEMDNGVIKRGTDNPSLRTYNPELLKELGIYAVYMNGSRRRLLKLKENLRKSGSELIDYLKENYTH